VDANVKALRQIAKDYNLPVIAISSLNRESYDSPISMASFKESGSIEFSSDCLLGLQYLGMMNEEDETDSGRKKRIRQLVKKVNEQRERGEAIPVQLRILKNRLAPPTDKVCFDFFSRYNCFNEIMGEPVAAGEIPEDIREQAEQQALQGL
jgi:replicative DNA helicase